MNVQKLLDALHGIQLWGQVGPARDPSLGKGRAGSNDEFLAKYKELEEEVEAAIEENDKLRELVWRYYDYLDQDRCTGCVTRWACDNHIGECWLYAKLEEMAAELNVCTWSPKEPLTDVPMWTYQEALEDLNEVNNWNEELVEDNRKLRELVKKVLRFSFNPYVGGWLEIYEAAEELGIDRFGRSQ